MHLFFNISIIRNLFGNKFFIYGNFFSFLKSTGDHTNLFFCDDKTFQRLLNVILARANPNFCFRQYGTDNFAGKLIISTVVFLTLFSYFVRNLFLKRFPVCSNLFVLLFLVTLCLAWGEYQFKKKWCRILVKGYLSMLRFSLLRQEFS